MKKVFYKTEKDHFLLIEEKGHFYQLLARAGENFGKTIVVGAKAIYGRNKKQRIKVPVE